MYGPNTSSEQYTDKGIVQGINRDEYMLSEIRSLIESTIKERGIYKPVPEIKVGWSDYKVQPETGWNFDIFETEGVRRWRLFFETIKRIWQI